MSKIYTKKGNNGKTFLGNGEQVWKNNQRVKTYGNFDEVNSLIGLIISQIELKKIYQKADLINNLLGVQSDLMLISSILANPKITINNILNIKTKIIEQLIDKTEEKLLPLNNFILPSGSLLCSSFHLLRSVCRRAERELVTLSLQEKVPKEILAYINRLSDYWFVLARLMNKMEGKKEIIWKIKNITS